MTNGNGPTWKEWREDTGRRLQNVEQKIDKIPDKIDLKLDKLESNIMEKIELIFGPTRDLVDQHEKKIEEHSTDISKLKEQTGWRSKIWTAIGSGVAILAFLIINFFKGK